jgi:hypothetical protein
VERVEDQRYLVAQQICDGMQRSAKTKEREFERKAPIYSSFSKPLAMAMFLEVQAMGDAAERWCDNVRAWYSQ